MKDSPYFEIRLESLGGLGANLCGKMLGELGVKYLGLNGAVFSSYGSEKRGSPVSSFIRWCDGEQEILINSPIREPDILGIFQESILKKYPWPDIRKMPGKMVINTRMSGEELEKNYPWLSGTVYFIDGISIGMQTKSRINMIMLGTMFKALEDEELLRGQNILEIGQKMVEETVGKKYPDLLEVNRDGLMAGYAMAGKRVLKSEHQAIPTESHEKWLWGYANAPIGGVNPLAGSMASNDLSASRNGYMPLFDETKCIHCGLCDTTCPDMVFQFKKGTYKGKEQMVNRGLDYHYCKGCLRCVTICPVNALVVGKEAEHPSPEWFTPDKDLVALNIHWTEKAADGYITGESYLTEGREEAGVK
ncbi:MAG: 4Fe-4S dicluster domain-containing protein [Clostridia bacterium]|nr:4Fe-4S dicluster domain-containing protein [Clostridia bacterium]NCD03291.1 4Fe-4S dicluster domain-containing protein [Clostridia bacterium]